MERHVLVIGAGQAGLAAGYHLRAAGVPFQIVDSHHRVGDSWRTRYDSLTLFTPRQFSALPGLELVGNRELYATRDEFAEYLESYAARLRLPITLGRQVSRLSKTDGESFEAQLDDGSIIVASEVIVATGVTLPPISPRS
ncbi:NAD(P)-binding domain-containing protein [Tianweitania sediminis]|uniref:NAD(P)-binding domain-containing protein n=1 Tax=Tianweitania sediminis TaxID=1502156 RepID=A0A8J7UJX5_9HYPH|nr:NAD(P)-binding domain-containing protein [Tianweitania sediminis]MBP0440508.1 NAD(P)-binding domain-containing protein [Tianweitania sediminis]